MSETMSLGFVTCGVRRIQPEGAEMTEFRLKSSLRKTAITMHPVKNSSRG